MAQVKQQVYRRTSDTTDGGEVVETEVVRHSSDEPARRLQNFILTLAGIISGLLLVRFLLSLFAANPANPFADFIYDLSSPLVSPFQGLFGVDTGLDTPGSHLEVETLVAIVVYYLIGWAIVHLIDAGRSNPPEPGA